MEAIRKGNIDLIVLDQNLQGEVSGLDYYEHLRASGNLTPAILVTGLNDEETLIRAVRGGLSDFVPKTTDYFADLVRAVERVIAQVRTRRKLVESEARLAGVTLLAEAIPQVVWTARADGHIDFANRRWIEYSGLTLEQTEGWNWCRSLHPDDLDPTSPRRNGAESLNFRTARSSRPNTGSDEVPMAPTAGSWSGENSSGTRVARSSSGSEPAPISTTRSGTSKT